MELNNLEEFLDWLFNTGLSTKTESTKETCSEKPRETPKTSNLRSAFENRAPKKPVNPDTSKEDLIRRLEELKKDITSFYNAVCEKLEDQDHRISAAFKQMTAVNDRIDALAESISSAEAGVDVTSEILGDLRACQETESEEDVGCPEEEAESEVESDTIDVISLIKLVKDFRARYRAESEELSEKIRTASVPKGYNDLSARVLNELSGKIRACDEILEAVGYY